MRWSAEGTRVTFCCVFMSYESLLQLCISQMKSQDQLLILKKSVMLRLVLVKNDYFVFIFLSALRKL